MDWPKAAAPDKAEINNNKNSACPTQSSLLPAGASTFLALFALGASDSVPKAQPLARAWGIPIGFGKWQPYFSP